MNPTVEFVVAESVGVLRVNRPASLNALNWAAQERFAEVVHQCAELEELRVLIVTGAGERTFVSGGDLKELANHPEEEAGARLNQTMSAALAELASLSLPVIAAVNGDAIGGGCEIVCACDLRVAAPHVRLSFAHVNNALTTGWGGTRRLVQLIGQSRAMELLLTGRMLSAQEAVKIGLLHRVLTAEEDLMTAALAWAGELKALPRDALAAAKTLAQSVGERSPAEVDRLEAEMFRALWTGYDHLEALKAFAEKRPPVFTDKKRPV